MKNGNLKFTFVGILKHLGLYVLSCIIGCVLIISTTGVIKGEYLSILLSFYSLPFSLPFAIMITFPSYLLFILIIKLFRLDEFLASYIIMGFFSPILIFRTQLPDRFASNDYVILIIIFLSGAFSGLIYGKIDGKLLSVRK